MICLYYDITHKIYTVMKVINFFDFLLRMIATFLIQELTVMSIENIYCIESKQTNNNDIEVQY